MSGGLGWGLGIGGESEALSSLPRKGLAAIFCTHPAPITVGSESHDISWIYSHRSQGEAGQCCYPPCTDGELRDEVTLP